MPVAQTRQWAEKMKILKMTYEYHELKGEGHGGFTTALDAVFKFFNKHPKPER